MATINAVSGALETSSLGVTLMHEHIIVSSPGVRENFHVWDRADHLERAVEKVTAAQQRGINTLVDLTPGDWRDIPFVQDVVSRTNMQIIVATGIYWEVPHYFRTAGGRSIEHIADLFVRDISDGIGETDVKAGIIKCATDQPGVTPDVERILRAASRAHRATGVPISTHTHALSEVGLKQQDIFESEGVDLSRVVIGHSGDTEDLEYLKRLIGRGSYIGMDRFGIDVYLSTEKRVSTIARLCEMGYADKMVLSHDAACYFDWYDPALVSQLAPNWNFNHIPDDVLPALQQAGVSDDQIRTMMVENPRRIFESQGAY